VAITVEPASSVTAGADTHTTGVSCNAITLLMTSINIVKYGTDKSFIVILLLVCSNLWCSILLNEKRMRVKIRGNLLEDPEEEIKMQFSVLTI
jgi:hypothetical protein